MLTCVLLASSACSSDDRLPVPPLWESGGAGKAGSAGYGQAKAGRGGGGAGGVGGRTTGAAATGGAGAAVGGGGAPSAGRYAGTPPTRCEATLPTGFCLLSDSGDFIGQGRMGTGTRADSVKVTGTGAISATLIDDSGKSTLSATFAAGEGKELDLGRYELAERFPFNMNSPGLSVSGDGRGCNSLTGEFTLTELGYAPDGALSRLSVEFEQHCEGGDPALRGVIHWNANGTPDTKLVADKSITLQGKVTRVTYDPDSHLAYGLDPTNRTIAKIDLAQGTSTTTKVVQVPNDACVDAARKRLFVVNKGSNSVSEYKLDTLELARDITWTPMDHGASETHFHVYCAKDRLYLVDGAWEPALFTVDDLDATPTVMDRTSKVAGVGGLVLNAAQDELFYWYQYGWGAGSLNTAVRRIKTSDLSMLDTTTLTASEGFFRDPVDAPILLDEQRGLVFSKNLIFDAHNLTRLVYTLPGKVDSSIDGAPQNTYALSVNKGLIASKTNVFELERYDVVTRTLTSRADQLFFDRDDQLWFLTTESNLLEKQRIEP